MRTMTAPVPISVRIRQLATEGLTRAQIRDALKVSYQRVRGVLANTELDEPRFRLPPAQTRSGAKLAAGLSEKRRSRYAAKVSDLVSSLDEARATFLSTATFGGPSLYFHLESLRARESGDAGRLAEMIYATLVAWGMHRMGPGGAKMTSFTVFRDSFEGALEAARPLSEVTPEQMDEQRWELLAAVFRTIKVMASGPILVGNSKVMAHMLPRLVPPVDRQYTLRFLGEANGLQNVALRGSDWQWQLLRDALEGFFYRVAESKEFVAAARRWQFEPRSLDGDQRCWETSGMKIVDNLVIGRVYPDVLAERRRRAQAKAVASQ
jgi:hypothetical protein